jgi:hypothetical protein
MGERENPLIPWTKRAFVRLVLLAPGTPAMFLGLFLEA